MIGSKKHRPPKTNMEPNIDGLSMFFRLPSHHLLGSILFFFRDLFSTEKHVSSRMVSRKNMSCFQKKKRG